MLDFLRRWWPVLKLLLFAAILVGVAWQFLNILDSKELQKADETRSPGEILWDGMCSARLAELVLAGLLYLGGLGFSAWFWLHLMHVVGQPLPAAAGVRAYYISHLGKYAPAKGVALVMRTSMAMTAGGKPAAALLTSIYETMATMAAGALLATVLILWQMGDDEGMLWKAVILFVLSALPIIPRVFNTVVYKASEKILRGKPPIDLGLKRRTLLAGLAITAAAWLFLGASLEVVLQSMSPEPSWSIEGWLRSTAYVAVSYVAAFVTPAPGGLGVREYFLEEFLRLKMDLGAQAVVVVVVLRVIWTAAELIMGGVVWLLPAGPHVTRQPVTGGPGSNGAAVVDSVTAPPNL